MIKKTMMRITKGTSKKLQLLKLEKGLGSAEDVITYLMNENLLLQSRVNTLIDKRVDQDQDFI